MLNLPHPVKENERISARTFNALIAAIKALRPKVGDGLVLRESGDGWIMNLAQRRPDLFHPAKITKVTPSTAPDVAGAIASTVTYDAVVLSTDDGTSAAAGDTRRVTGAAPYNRIVSDLQRIRAPEPGSACFILSWWTDPMASGGSEEREDVLILIAQERPVARVCEEPEEEEGGE